MRSRARRHRRDRTKRRRAIVRITRFPAIPDVELPAVGIMILREPLARHYAVTNSAVLLHPGFLSLTAIRYQRPEGWPMPIIVTPVLMSYKSTARVASTEQPVQEDCFEAAVGPGAGPQ